MSRTGLNVIALVVATLCAPLALGRAGRGPLAPAIYPPVVNRTLRFSHGKHGKLPCARCHPAAGRSVSPVDRNLPGEATCRQCHAEVTRKEDTRPGPGPRPASACRLCHTAYGSGPAPARAYYPPANLRFSHQAHGLRGIACTACHRSPRPAPQGRDLPTMSTCTGCHRQRSASTRCPTCHLAQKDGRLRTRFPSGLLKPDGSVGANHNATFSRSHAAAARANRRACSTCHASRDCLRCHGGSLRPMRIHGGDYVKRHGQDARRGQPRCQSCHRTQRFCRGCHQRTGVGPESRRSGFRPSTSRHFHPPGFASVQRGPGHHSYSARRSLQTCSSCHREQTCIRCHGSASVGRGGFSPHPRGFRGSGKCRALSARNQRVCLKCHRLGDAAIDCR